MSHKEFPKTMQTLTHKNFSTLSIGLIVNVKTSRINRSKIDSRTLLPSILIKSSVRRPFLFEHKSGETVATPKSIYSVKGSFLDSEIFLANGDTNLFNLLAKVDNMQLLTKTYNEPKQISVQTSFL